MPRFQIVNFGCRANQADGSILHEALSRCGFDSCTGQQRADIVVLNSCTVTAGADTSVRQAARRIHRQNPAARIIITGCYAQRSPAELAALPGVEFVVGNSHKAEIARLVLRPAADDHAQFVPLDTLLTTSNPPQLDADRAPDDLFHYPASSLPSASAKILHGDMFNFKEFFSSPVLSGLASDRTRPNLKIQDGCNNRCSFCIIPSVRGRSRSLPPGDVLKHVRTFCEAGHREVVLSGINLGRYGRDLDTERGGKMRFAQLIRAILEETPIERLRLSSVEPMDFTNELLDLMASSPRIAKHIHAPLQSGSDRILRLMHRKYHPHNYRDRIEAAFARMPNAAFGADVMVGFPGESNEDFEETRRMIESLPFTYLHVFPYSRRPGTPADQMDGHGNGAVVRDRARILRELAAEKNLRFRQRQLGRVLEAITLITPDPLDTGNESSASLAGTNALSDHFLNVLIPGERLPANCLLRVRISGLYEDGLVGEKQQPEDQAVSIPMVQSSPPSQPPDALPLASVLFASV